MKKIHDAGVVHGSFGVSDILIANTRPFVVNFKHAAEMECKRKLDIMEGAAAPKREQFGCTELYRLCVDLQIWKTSRLQCLGSYCVYPTTLDVGTFTFEGRGFSVEYVSKPVALELSNDSGRMG
jgi:hypothetical protein